MSAGNRWLGLGLLLALAGLACTPESSHHYADIAGDIEKIVSGQHPIGMFPFIDHTGTAGAVRWRSSDVIKYAFIRGGLVDAFAAADVYSAFNRGFIRWNDTVDIREGLELARQVHLEYAVIGSIEEYNATEYPQVTLALRIFRVSDGKMLYYAEQSGAAPENRYNIPGRRKKSVEELLAEVCTRLVAQLAADIQPVLATIKQVHLPGIREMLLTAGAYNLAENEQQYLKENSAIIESFADDDAAPQLAEVRTILQVENRLHEIMLAHKVEQRIIDLAARQ